MVALVLTETKVVGQGYPQDAIAVHAQGGRAKVAGCLHTPHFHIPVLGFTIRVTLVWVLNHFSLPLGKPSPACKGSTAALHDTSHH